MRLALHGAPLAQVVEVGIRVVDEGVVAEEVERVEVAHRKASVTAR